MAGARVLTALAELLFPPRCQVCHRFCPCPLCAPCRDAFERIRPPWCDGCGKPFDPQAHARPRCPECLSERAPLRHARSYGFHVGTLREAVNGFKFGGHVRLGAPLGRVLAELVGGDPAHGLPDPSELTAVVPVPLHPARRRWRGFDQAELLAAGLSEVAGLPVAADLLARIRNTRPQVGLPRRERLLNVRGAFEVRDPARVAGARLLLLDDVYTTGATLRECARVLRAAGAASVDALTVSRRAPDWHPASDLLPGRGSPDS